MVERGWPHTLPAFPAQPREDRDPECPASRMSAGIGDATRASSCHGQRLRQRLLVLEQYPTGFCQDSYSALCSFPALLGFFPPNPWRVFGLFREGLFGGVFGENSKSSLSKAQSAGKKLTLRGYPGKPQAGTRSPIPGDVPSASKACASSQSHTCSPRLVSALTPPSAALHVSDHGGP